MTELTIEGMTCGHCRKSVEEALKNVDGVSSVDVDLDAGRARVEVTANASALVAAVEAEGYAAQGRVRTLVCTPAGEQLLATVAGSGRQLYQTIVRRLGDGADWVGRCRAWPRKARPTPGSSMPA